MNDKKAKKLEKDLKSWKKSLRILKKINDRIKIVEEKGKYVVLQRKGSKSSDEWIKISITHSFSKAINKKHNAIQIIIRDLGYRPRFLDRRKKRKAQRDQRSLLKKQ